MTSECLKSDVASDVPDGFELLPGMGRPEEFGLTTPASIEARRRRDEQLKRSIQVSYLKGLQKGLEETAFWKEKAVKEVGVMVRSIERVSRSFRKELEEILVDLVTGMSEKIVRYEMSREPERFLRERIKGCLELLERETALRLYVNQQDRSILDRILSDEKSLAESLKDVRIIPAPSISPGGCQMETDKGIIHATIEDQIEKLKEALENELGKDVNVEMESASDGSGQD